ncbi:MULTISPECIES: DNA repair protein [Micromonospora]|uniref:DNA repair protein n=1 Tax=Micromonospora chalcea TaxID=1874 RepID=A0ABX9Y3D3_MICCH|nr:MULTISPECIES: DNA repair protein [Micromonospora]ODB80771.1 DNA repair protein [Micromonospora sp. II]RQW90801.1 DNA repair protein [Micromonospora chalcea]RQX12486.1 DNA repair protein [Micromonospora chalcea]
MPHEPNDRFQQDPERNWRAARDAGRFPAQRAYREARNRGLSWAELNAQPSGAAAWRGSAAA